MDEQNAVEPRRTSRFGGLLPRVLKPRVAEKPADSMVQQDFAGYGARIDKSLLEIILSGAILDTIRKEVMRNTGITTTVQTLAAVIRTGIVDPQLVVRPLTRH